MSARHRKLRYEFADESKANMFGSDGIRYVWKKPGSGISDSDFIPTVKYGSGKLLFWSCFSWSGVGRIRIDGTMMATDYVDILKNGYLVGLKKWKKTFRDTIFMQDNDPKHKAKLTMDFHNSKKFKMLE